MADSEGTERYSREFRRMREATEKAGRLEQENTRLRDLVAVLVEDKSQLALWKRIANQRRELKWANHYAEVYYRMYWKQQIGKADENE